MDSLGIAASELSGKQGVPVERLDLNQTGQIECGPRSDPQSRYGADCARSGN
jgi:hypothetical protein